MNTVLVEIMFPWNGQSHRTQDLRLSRVPCVGEHIEVADGHAARVVETVIHLPASAEGYGHRPVAQVRIK